MSLNLSVNSQKKVSSTGHQDAADIL